MIRLTLVAVFACALVCGCSLFRGGTDPAVVKARDDANAAVAAEKTAQADLDATRAREARGEATAADIAAAEAKLAETTKTADEKIKALEGEINRVGSEQGKLGGWGAAIGAIFGPIGAAVGGVAGTVASAFVAWRKAKALRGVVMGIQAAREDLHKSAPEALAKSDDAMKRAIPKELQVVIEALKKKYGLKITG